MNELIIKENNKIENLIYEIRGKQVMLDSDLAKLYECANGTKTINLAVKRHINRFPERFMFQLTKQEYYEILRFQSETIELEKGKYSKYLPYAFTEQGVAMLATILRTKVAEEVSIRIMDAFVAMRKYISSSLIEQKYINNLVLEDHSKLKELENTFNKMQEKEKISTIFFEGQIFDAYTLLLDLFDHAENEIIIIDNYVSKELLKILKNINKKILIISKNYDEMLIKKYNSQYFNIEFINLDIFHDRFLIIDRKELYSCGASFKDLGKKCFAINKMESLELINNLLDKILNNKSSIF